METAQFSNEFLMQSHRDHDKKWLVPHHSRQEQCLACLMEFLESEDTFFVRKKRALAVFLELLRVSSHFVVDILKEERLITQHICYIFIGITSVVFKDFKFHPIILNIRMDQAYSHEIFVGYTFRRLLCFNFILFYKKITRKVFLLDISISSINLV